MSYRVEQITLPCYWASALVNDDWDNLTDAAAHVRLRDTVYHWALVRPCGRRPQLAMRPPAVKSTT